jgi:hypothetical protein
LSVNGADKGEQHSGAQHSAFSFDFSDTAILPNAGLDDMPAALYRW